MGGPSHWYIIPDSWVDQVTGTAYLTVGWSSSQVQHTWELDGPVHKYSIPGSCMVQFTGIAYLTVGWFSSQGQHIWELDGPVHKDSISDRWIDQATTSHLTVGWSNS